MNKFISLFFVIIALGILVGCNDRSGSLDKTLKNTLEDVIDAAKDGDAERYKSNWDKDHRDHAYSRQDVTESTMSMLPKKISHIEIISIDEAKGEAILTFKVRNHDGQGKAWLVNETDGWKIKSIRVDKMCYLE